LAAGAPGFEQITAEEDAMRGVRDAERRAVDAVMQGNATRRALEAEAQHDLDRAMAAAAEGAPPAQGSDVSLSAPHREPPFDPAVRRELSRQPEEPRGRVARRDSVLFDHAGTQRRVEASAGRAEAAISRQREVGRREFEMRQQRNSEGLANREVRSEQRRVAEFQRLEASQMAEFVNRAAARRQVIRQNAASTTVDSDAARDSIGANVDTRRARARELVVSARQRQTEFQNTAANARSTGISARQREVFQLQMEVANTRRLARENPPEPTGGESQELLARSRTGIQRFQQFRADKQVALGQVEQGRDQGRSRRDDVAREIDDGRLNKAQERSQNIRRRLASTYSGQGGKAASQRIGQPA